MRSLCPAAIVTLITVCSMSVESEVPPPPPQDCRPPPENCIITIWSICAVEVAGYRTRYRTFSSPCDMEEYNCIHGTNYREYSGGPCERQPRAEDEEEEDVLEEEGDLTRNATSTI